MEIKSINASTAFPQELFTPYLSIPSLSFEVVCSNLVYAWFEGSLHQPTIVKWKVIFKDPKFNLLETVTISG